MFCSSLRRRNDWAAVLSTLAGSGTSKWRETLLDTHDVAFPVESGVGRGGIATFRAILLSSTEVGTQQTKARIDRLHHLNGGVNIAIFLLLKGDNAMEAFIRLQVELLNAIDIPIIPLGCAAELVSRISDLRNQYQRTKQQAQQKIKPPAAQSLLRYCVGGINAQPLSGSQTNILMGMTSGFQDLAAIAFDVDGQRKICDSLGDRDGHSVLAFLSAGPRSSGL